jgi:hypothetical protein
MAARNHSRRTRRRGRTVGNRPQRLPAPANERLSSTALGIALKEVRSHIDVAGAVAAIVVAALKAQHADSDTEAAVALQRCVCDVLAAESERLAQLSADLADSAARAP